MKNYILNGINIQQPWAQFILNKKKTIETRSYKIPEKHIGKPIAIIETPGTNGKFKARIIGLVIFKKSFQYKSRNDFIQDEPRHLVDDNDPSFSWKNKKTKWGWEIEKVIKLNKYLPAPTPRGIVFCSKCTIPTKLLDEKLS